MNYEMEKNIGRLFYRCPEYKLLIFRNYKNSPKVQS